MAEMRTLFHKPEGETEWRLVELHAVDAVHALEADPDHWKAEKPTEAVEPQAETEAKAEAETEQ